MSLQKHFFLIAIILALLSLTAYFKYDMEKGWYWLIPFGFALLAVLFIFLSNKKQVIPSGIKLTSIIMCPHCGHKEKEIMPENACEYFYECKKCNTRLKPKEGDCCVYCSYGTEKCPPVQEGQKCC